MRFFLIAFGVSWTLWIVAPNFAPAALVAGFAPSLAALACGVRPSWRAPAWKIAVAFAAPSALALATGRVTFGPPAILAATLAPLGEELGWRGWLQPRAGSAATGLVWASWHLPVSGGDWGYLARIAMIGFLVGEFGGGSLPIALAAHAGVNLGVVRAADAKFLDLLLCSVTLIVLCARFRSRIRRTRTT